VQGVVLHISRLAIAADTALSDMDVDIGVTPQLICRENDPARGASNQGGERRGRDRPADARGHALSA
jgi:hypothetical protein